MNKNVTKGEYFNDNLMSDLGKFKKQLTHQSVHIDKTYRQILQERFSHGTKLGKTIYTHFVGDDTIESLDYLGVPCYNFGGNKKIKLNSMADIINNRGSGIAWFHEHGHLIDDALGMISDNEVFRQLLDNDLMNCRFVYARKYHLKSIDEIDTKISMDLCDMHLHSDISDIMEGLTESKIVNVSGHGVDYWMRDKKIVTSEAFAHMFECQFDKDRYKKMKKYFPKSLEYFEFMLNYLKGVEL